MMKKFLSLLLILVLCAGFVLHALADGSDTVLALYVQNEGIDVVLVRRYTADCSLPKKRANEVLISGHRGT